MNNNTQTLGSVWWCLQGILVFCYFDRTSKSYTNTESALAFLGGTTFLFGAYMGWVESLNPARDADFAWVVEEESKTLIKPERHGQHLGRGRAHFGRHWDADIRQDSSTSDLEGRAYRTERASTGRSTSPPPPWRWYGTKRSLAYVANTIQLFGAVVFEISVISGLPGVLPESGTAGGPQQSGRAERLWIALYWSMQVRKRLATRAQCSRRS
jgi:hypothetical protein